MKKLLITILLLICPNVVIAGGGDFGARMMEQREYVEEAIYEKYVPKKSVSPKAQEVRPAVKPTASIEVAETVARKADEQRPPEWLISFIVILLTMFPAPVLAVSIITGIIGNLIIIRVFWVWIDRLIRKIMGKK